MISVAPNLRFGNFNDLCGQNDSYAKDSTDDTVFMELILRIIITIMPTLEVIVCTIKNY